MRGKILLLPCALASLFGPLSDAWARDYSELNVTRIRVGKPRPASCYSPKIGHYDCLQVGVVIVYKRANGEEASISTSHKLNGSYVATIRKDFGPRFSKLYFESAKEALGQLPRPYGVPSDLKLSPSNARLMKSLAEHVTRHMKSIDLAKDPEAVFEIRSLDALYGLTDALLRVESTEPARREQLAHRLGMARALTAIFKGGLDVGTALTPFVNDSRDFYELVTGRDLISGASIGYDGRFLSAVALIAGSGSLYRKAVDRLKKTFWKSTLKRASGGIPGLKYTGRGRWVSEAGLVYRGSTGTYENRLRHIFHHGIKRKNKPGKSLFATKDIKEIPKLLDEAWKKRGSPVPGKPGTFIIDMGRRIGSKGEKRVVIVVDPGSKKLVTAFPKK